MEWLIWTCLWKSKSFFKISRQPLLFRIGCAQHISIRMWILIHSYNIVCLATLFLNRLWMMRSHWRRNKLIVLVAPKKPETEYAQCICVIHKFDHVIHFRPLRIPLALWRLYLPRSQKCMSNLQQRAFCRSTSHVDFC